MAEILERTLVGELVAHKGLLTCLPETSTVEQLIKMMCDYDMTAVPIASSATTLGANVFIHGDTRCIGLVSMLDVVLHLAENLRNPDWASGMCVARIIGQTTQSRRFWTVDPSFKLQDGLDYFSRGVHRFLVPSLGSEAIDYGNGEENGSMTAFRMLTATDVVHFFTQHLDELGPSVTRTVEELGLLHPDILALAVPSNMRVVNAMRLMRQRGGSTSLAVVESREDGDYLGAPQRWVRGGKILGTLSVSDFRRLGVDAQGDLAMMTVGDFMNKACRRRGLVTCPPTARLGHVMGLAMSSHVQRVWVTDDDGWLLGEVKFSDMIATVRRSPRSFRLA